VQVTFATPDVELGSGVESFQMLGVTQRYERIVVAVPDVNRRLVACPRPGGPVLGPQPPVADASAATLRRGLDERGQYPLGGGGFVEEAQVVGAGVEVLAQGADELVRVLARIVDRGLTRTTPSARSWSPMACAAARA